LYLFQFKPATPSIYRKTLVFFNSFSAPWQLPLGKERKNCVCVWVLAGVFHFRVIILNFQGAARACVSWVVKCLWFAIVESPGTHAHLSENFITPTHITFCSAKWPKLLSSNVICACLYFPQLHWCFGAHGAYA